MTAIPYTRETNFTGLRLERNATGYIHSPWFTFATTPGMAAHDTRSNYHWIVGQSKDAFAHLVGMESRDVVVTQKPDDFGTGELWWKLSSKKPMDLPKRKQQKLNVDAPAIDI